MRIADLSTSTSCESIRMGTNRGGVEPPSNSVPLTSPPASTAPWSRQRRRRLRFGRHAARGFIPLRLVNAASANYLVSADFLDWLARLI